VVGKLRANVYIDGFNLYYGSVRRTNLKWLNLAALCTELLPSYQINRIRYFTAHVRAFKHDLDAPVRQDIYLRALGTIPNLEIHRGHFKPRAGLLPQYPLAYIRPGKPPHTVQVLRMEEKVSDVSLATHLLFDCFEKDFDVAVVISNDSDLVPAVEIVITKYKKPVGVINPHPRKKLSRELERTSTWCMQEINKKVLAECQFPPMLTDSQGTFSKPATW